MAAKLVAEEGILKGLVLSLEEGEQWVIGRDPDSCQLLVEDPSASRKHLVCRTTPQGILVENLSQTNPVQVNDEEVKEPRLLQNGDAVKIGNGMFRFYAEAAAHLFKDEPSRADGEQASGESPQINKIEEEAKPKEEEEKEPKPEAETPKEEEKEAKPEAETPKEEAKEKEPTPEAEKPKEEPNLPKNDAAVKEEAKKQEEPKTAEKENAALPNVTPAPEGVSEEEDDVPHHSIFEEEPTEKDALAEINFGLLDTGRWLLKVIGGPNNGAEFSMVTGTSYVIGTDPNSCDIVFHDTSVSRQHARITVGQDDALQIEDLKSRNGTLVDGEPLKAKLPLAVNTLVSMGTTSFIVFDREGEMQTIISPLMPSIVKVLQKEEAKKTEEEAAAAAAGALPGDPAAQQGASASATSPIDAKHATHPHATIGAFILIGIITGIFVIVGIGTSTLFKSEPVTVTESVDPTKVLDETLAPFYPNVKYTFNKSTGRLLLVGHVLTASDKNQLLYALQGLKFIKNLDDSGIVIDEYVWHEINQVLGKNPDWKGITVQSPTAGHFILTGYLKTRAQADRLAEYMTNNFPYLDLLEKRVVVDEDIIASVNNLLDNMGFRDIKVKLDNGEVTLTGKIPIGKSADIDALIAEVKSLQGVRSVRNLISEVAPEQSMINISDKYEVTGISNQGGTNLNVVINGRILMKGDVLDGMTITSIQANTIFLEKDGVKYRIDFSK